MSELNSIIDRYYRTWFRFHPEVAVDLGVEGYAHLLRPYDEDEISALRVLNEKLISSLDELDLSLLTQDQQIDAQLMRGAAVLELEGFKKRDWRLTDPSAFLPVHAVYQLTVRDVDNKSSVLKQRLQLIPGYLRGARRWLEAQPETIPRVWLDAAQKQAVGGIKFFRELKTHPEIQSYRLAEELDLAAIAIEEFAQFMERNLSAKAQGDFACGKRYFDLVLQERHFLNITAEELFRFGEKLFNETEAELTELTQSIQGNCDVEELTKKIQLKHPKREELLNCYRQYMQEAKQFVEKHQLVTIPAKDSLKVIETPEFLQHEIPFAAYYEPSPVDSMQHGYYYVTPPANDDDLAEHNYISMKHTCVHEAWPGHHLQFVTANLDSTSSSLPRLINASATMYEGWALYCEQLMHELGFIEEKESKFILLKDRLWRALRIMIDVGIHTMGMSLEDAAKLMQEKLGFSHGQAMADLTWYTAAPGVPMGYATGWAMINTLKSQEMEKEKFELKHFHDTLLSSGSIALPLVIVRGFGLSAWQKTHHSVFSNLKLFSQG